MEEYKSNSHLSKQNEEQERMTKIIKGDVKVRKRDGLSRFKDIFLPEDTKSVNKYVLIDILIPMVKKFIVETVNAFLYGGRSSNSSSSQSKVSYVSYYNKPTATAEKPSRSYDYNEVIFSTAAEAQEVLMQMEAVIEAYKKVTVLDFYDLVGITGNQFTDYNFGWTNLKNATVHAVRDGYVINFPKVIPFD